MASNVAVALAVEVRHAPCGLRWARRGDFRVIAHTLGKPHEPP
jgi:hypothetical protein